MSAVVINRHRPKFTLFLAKLRSGRLLSHLPGPANGGQGTTKTRHGLGPTAGLVRITQDMYSIPDRLDCFYKGVLVASTGWFLSESATLQWAYNPQPSDPN